MEIIESRNLMKFLPIIVALLFIALAFGLGKGEIGLISATISGVLGGGILSALFSRYYDKLVGPVFTMKIEDRASERSQQIFSPNLINVREGGHRESWLRGLIYHNGAFFAQGCEVLLTRISYLGAPQIKNTTPRSFEYFDNLPLFWSARGRQTSIDLLPGIRYCFDLACVKRGSDKLIFELRSSSFPPRYDEVFSNFGLYSVSFVIGSKNAQPIRYSCKFEWLEITNPDGLPRDILRWVENSLLRE